jgi:hypothetical protein
VGWLARHQKFIGFLNQINVRVPTAWWSLSFTKMASRLANVFHIGGSPNNAAYNTCLKGIQRLSPKDPFGPHLVFSNPVVH